MEKTINVMKRIFEFHYGVGLAFQWSGDLSKDEFFLWSQCEKSFIYSRNLHRAYFPFFTSQKYLKALVTVEPVFKEDLLKEMADFLDLTVGKPLRLHEMYDEQSQKEDLLKRLIADPKKIVPFRGRHPSY